MNIILTKLLLSDEVCDGSDVLGLLGQADFQFRGKITRLS